MTSGADPSMKPTLMRRALSHVAGRSLDWAIRYALRGEGWRARGIEIRVRLVKGDRKPYAQQVANALGIIARFDPLRLARIQRDISGILVSALVSPGAAAQYQQEYALCMLDSAILMKYPPVIAALSIVHEATHARIGAIPITAENINRIERICVSQELAFAERLPSSESLQKWLQEKIAATRDMDYSRRGQAARGIAALEEQGVSQMTLAALHGMARHAGCE